MNTPQNPQQLAEQLAAELLIDAEIDDEGVQQLPPPTGPRWLLALGMVLIGINLRPALSSLAPVLGQVKTELGISATTAGLLTTLPVLGLGLFGALAPQLARRYGSERSIAGVLLLLACGIALRSQLGLHGLVIGSLLSGAAIGIIGVLLPGIVKRDFPTQAGLMTGVYTMALCLGAALAAGATVPLDQLFGQRWQPALAFWAIPALLALAVWWPQLHTHQQQHAGHWRVRGLWRDPLAWQVTIYMGLQSSLSYIVFGWMPSILIERGLTPLQAGLMMSLSIMTQVIASLGVPLLAQRCTDQRLPIACVMGMTLGGLLGMLYAPTTQLWLWAVLLGIGQGGAFSMALGLLVLRAPDAHVAAHLSGMAQGVGYTVAACGPLAAGIIHDIAGRWAPVGWLFGAIVAIALCAGWLAGRKLLVRARAERLD
ncbi:cyanate transport protein CynX [Aquitalea magnusonii]|uniref:Cyanate transport protein CynX n=1 Tax=Aquitalea magnusonii TaxID=332411 RepID=A0A3G9GKP7_9NEIS|nr:MFS transporter [Aquitalea magnusonii]BBF86771.1 cyanate transport protein CynX [Aquitalea magnusonii]